jgi:hypothetical protein
MQKVPGVSSVKVSLNEGLTVLDLTPDNAVTLAGLRQIIRNNGFVTNESSVVVRGTITESNGTLSLQVRNSGERLMLRPAAKAPALFEELRSRVKSPGRAEVEITATADTKDPKAMVLSVTKIQP